jgi:hypothetical protein
MRQTDYLWTVFKRTWKGSGRQFLGGEAGGLSGELAPFARRPGFFL